MSDPILWAAVGAIATGVSAIVTATTVVFIARQTSATRRAAEAGEETARVAVDSLASALKEQGRTYFLAVEAVKARIDNTTPQITLTAAETVVWPPVVPSQFGEAQPHTSGEPFRLPRDGTSRLMVRLGVTIRNEGSRTVSLRFGVPLMSRGLTITTSSLEPGQKLDGWYFEIGRSVAEWAAIYEQRSTGAPGEEFLFQVIYVDNLDTGVIEYHEVLFGGTLLTPIPNETGAWTLINYPDTPPGDPGGIGWQAQPTKRRYFLSRTRGIELPEIDLEA